MSKTQLLIKQILLGALLIVAIGIYLETREHNHALVDAREETSLHQEYLQKSMDIRLGLLEDIRDSLSDAGE